MAAYLQAGMESTPPWLIGMFGFAITGLFGALVKALYDQIKGEREFRNTTVAELKTLIVGLTSAITASTEAQRQTSEQGRIAREQTSEQNRAILAGQDKITRAIDDLGRTMDGRRGGPR